MCAIVITHAHSYLYLVYYQDDAALLIYSLISDVVFNRIDVRFLHSLKVTIDYTDDNTWM